MSNRISSSITFIVVLMLLCISNAYAATAAATCYVTTPGGDRYYKHTGLTKTLGTVSAIKPCADNPVINVYVNEPGAACYMLDANGNKLYKHNGVAKVIGDVANLPACDKNPIIVIYDDPRGMRLYVNHKDQTEQDCLFLKVANGVLQTYFAGTPILVKTPIINELGETVGEDITTSSYTCD